MIAASVVLLPEPVTPVSNTRPLFNSESFRSASGNPSPLHVGMLLGISNTIDKEARGEQALGTGADIPTPVDGQESFDETK